MAATLRFATRLAVWLVVFGQPWQACCAQACGEFAGSDATATAASPKSPPEPKPPVASGSCCAVAATRPASNPTRSSACCAKPAPTQSRAIAGCAQRNCDTYRCGTRTPGQTGQRAEPAVGVSCSPATVESPSQKPRGCCGSTGCTPSQSVCCAGEYFPKLPPQSADHQMLDAAVLAAVPCADLIAPISLPPVHADYVYPIPWETHTDRLATLCSWLK